MIIFFITTGLLACQPSEAYLVKLDLKNGYKYNTLEVDSIRRVSLLYIQQLEGGEYPRTDYAVRLQDEDVTYKIAMRLSGEKRISKEFVALVKKQDKLNWGWFEVKGGKIMPSVAGIEDLLDSVQTAYPASFVKEENGRIFIFREGQIVRTLDYGSLKLRRDLKVDNLLFKLYKLGSDKLEAVSDDVDAVYEQPDGIYFVPSPGLRAKLLIDKDYLYHLLDSLRKASSYPAYIPLESNMILIHR